MATINLYENPNATATAEDDTIYGSSGDDIIYGLDGNDYIVTSFLAGGNDGFMAATAMMTLALAPATITLKAA